VGAEREVKEKTLEHGGKGSRVGHSQDKTSEKGLGCS